MYIQQLGEIVPPPRHYTVGVCNQLSFLVLYYDSSRLVPLLEVINAPIQVPDIVDLTTRLSLSLPQKRAHGLFRGRLGYGECATHCFRSAPSLQSRGGYKPSINTPRSDPTQLHLPSSPWLQALRNVEQIFRSRFPRFRVWLIAVQCVAARDHVPRIYPPTSILAVGLNFTPYSETSIVLSVTTSLRSSKHSVEVGVYLRWFGRFCLSCIVRHRKENRITELLTLKALHTETSYMSNLVILQIIHFIVLPSNMLWTESAYIRGVVGWGFTLQAKRSRVHSRWCRSFSLTVALGLTHALTEMSTGNISWV